MSNESSVVSTHVALFRAINVGGHGKVAMADLRAAAEAIGLEAPRTLLQTGNLLFRSAGRPSDDLARDIEAAVAASLGLQTSVILRSAVEWRAMLAANPFVEMAQTDPAHLLVMALAAEPEPRVVATLASLRKGSERIAVLGRAAYIAYPDGIGRSKLTSAVLERHLGTIGTGRNWTTATRIAAMLAA